MKKHATAIVALAAMLCLAFALTACSTPTKKPSNEGPEAAYATGIHHATVTMKDYGSFVITLDADKAPITVQNFCKLANSGFYDGLTFHRCVPDFCLQGGDPKGDGKGSTGERIKGEFAQNAVANSLADNFTTGTVAMARTGDLNGASCQFFITLSPAYASSLNGAYAAFGTVDTQGMKAVDAAVQACKDYADPRSGAINDKSKQPVIESITITD